MNIDKDKYYNLKEAGEILGVNKETIRYHIGIGNLKAETTQTGAYKKYAIRGEDLINYKKGSTKISELVEEIRELREQVKILINYVFNLDPKNENEDVK